MLRKKKSQSLVNEGRFPHEAWLGSLSFKEFYGRNPSLMRAGFHDLELKLAVCMFTVAIPR